MDIASGDAGSGPGPGPGPGPAGPLASPEAMSMRIDDISTIASPFPKKVNPHLQNPLLEVSYRIKSIRPPSFRSNASVRLWPFRSDGSPNSSEL